MLPGHRRGHTPWLRSRFYLTSMLMLMNHEDDEDGDDDDNDDNDDDDGDDMVAMLCYAVM